ncbi:MAG: MerR family transcriptional regulator [Oscillospiraceae bacterium]|nr:MerR family transcriptional regulator [Oscillospiraceae bacterium]
MKKDYLTVKDVSSITGVSVRTLHHYDSIGLLKPATITESGYRLYNDASLKKLQSILLFRELEFPLKEIEKIVNNPDFDSIKAVKDQRELLTLKRKHIDGLIALADELIIQEDYMAFKKFDRAEMERYAEEVKQRWGATDQYSEYAQKSRSRTADQHNALGTQLMDIFAEIGKLTNLSPEDEQVQAKVKELQDFITANYYSCTKDILKGLGSMYIADKRFKENIDKAGGEGAAAFVAKAIELYCKE